MAQTDPVKNYDPPYDSTNYPPVAGQIRVLGEDSSTSFNNLVGYLPEERGLYRKMRVLELLHFFATLKGNRDGKVDARFWFEELGLSEWGNEKVETLSKGMSQKTPIYCVHHRKTKIINY